MMLAASSTVDASERWHLAGLLVPVLLSALPTTAQAESAEGRRVVAIVVGEPAGFGNLVAPQQAVVDIYFGGKRLGDAQVVFQPGSLRFSDPAKLVALLPDLLDPSAVTNALGAARLRSNAQLVCMPGSDPAKCGRLSPEVAAIIFDRERFRVDVFVNPQMLAVKSVVPEQYLPPADEGLSLVDSIGAVVSGASQGSHVYNVQDRLILGDAEKRLRAEFSYASGFGLQADRLAVEIDKPEWRYSAGAFWAPGTDLIGRRKIIGLGIETQIDTRLDKEIALGNPLVVFLDQRARVDILREGRVLASRIYESGNQSLDTSELPDGSYEVLLRIEEANGNRREERRFFTRNPRIAAPGQKIYFAYAGVLTNDLNRGFLSPTSTPFFQAGAARRLSPHVAADFTLVTTDRAALGEIGAYYISGQMQVRFAAVGSSNGNYGGLIQFSSQGNSRFNYNLDLRHIQMSSRRSADSAQPAAIPVDQAAWDLSGLPLAINSFTQLGGNFSYSLPNAQLSVSGIYRRETGQRANYTFGPSARWEFLRKGSLSVSLTGDVAFTDRGRSGFLGVSLQILGARSSLGAHVGVRSDAVTHDARRSAPVGGVTGSWQNDDVAGAELNVGGAYEHDIDQELATAAVNLRSEKASLSADVIDNFGADRGQVQYSLGLQTTVAVRGGTVAFEGRHTNDSMVVIKVDGAKLGNEFDVLINDGPAGTVRSGSSLAVSLPPYHMYNVHIRPRSADSVHYDGAVRRVGLYPGNVAQLSWSVTTVSAMFGRLVYEDGQPIVTAAITARGGIGETDENGYFQIETEDGAVLEIALPGGDSCRVTPPPTEQSNGYASIGTMICHPERSANRWASADPAHPAH